MPVYAVNGGAVVYSGNTQPTKQSNPTTPSNMTGIKMINDVLIIPVMQHR
jgi:hypothetical protein